LCGGEGRDQKPGAKKTKKIGGKELAEFEGEGGGGGIGGVICQRMGKGPGGGNSVF